MKKFAVRFHADASAASPGKSADFNEDFYGWQKTTSEDDRQMKFGDLGVFQSEGEDQDSNSSF